MVVQDYQYLNKWMMKNNYLLPSNLDIIKNIRMKKVFNVQIKERNK